MLGPLGMYWWAAVSSGLVLRQVFCFLFPDFKSKNFKYIVAVCHVFSVEVSDIYVYI